MKRRLFAELRRRNVFRACIAYVALGWIVTQVTGTVQPMLHLPDWIGPVVLWIGVIGFPFVIIFSWVYELTPEGLKREREVDRSSSITHVTGRRLDYIIVGLLVVAIGFTAFDRYGPRRPAGVSASPATMDSSVPATAVRAAVRDDTPSIAVLPFVNMSEDKANEFFSDGISEELLNLLAKIPALHVAARTSSFSFKGKDVPIPEIAKTLLVAHVLEGSVRKSGDQVRITAQLIRAADGYHVWSETFDRKLDDIFKIQDEISAKVVEQLKVSLLGAAPKARTTDPRAYALYLQARELGRQMKADAFKQSDALYQQALAIDPRYAPAWDGLSTNLANETSISALSNQEGLARSRAAAEKALAIDPDYAPGHASLGWVAMYGDNDLAGAARHFERALALDPTNLDVLRNTSTLLYVIGRLDEAVTLSEAVLRHDPVNVTALSNLAYEQRMAGRYDDAIALFRTVLSLVPGRGGTHASLEVALLLKGDAAGALAAIEQETTESWRKIGLPMAYCALGRKADADRAFDEVIAKFEKESSYNIAYGYAFCSNADKAFEWLDKAVAYEDPGLGEIAAENLFDKIRSDARWLPFMRKVGKAPEQLAKIEFKVTLPAEWQADATAQGSATPAATGH
ncbi:MAG TPA: tetratricopeptide repeat protein [Rhodanobacteraceae bacterium]|nr:tetratricopeptide repeat protein [Rhodanobacteraceae bacterium]